MFIYYFLKYKFFKFSKKLSKKDYNKIKSNTLLLQLFKGLYNPYLYSLNHFVI